MEFALSNSSNGAINALLDLGAKLDGLPHQAGYRTHNGRTLFLETGDAIGLVDLLHGQDDEIFPRLHSAALESQMRKVIHAESMASSSSVNAPLSAQPEASPAVRTSFRRRGAM